MPGTALIPDTKERHTTTIPVILPRSLKNTTTKALKAIGLTKYRVKIL
jgi:hypothetical protein